MRRYRKACSCHPATATSNKFEFEVRGIVLVAVHHLLTCDVCGTPWATDSAVAERGGGTTDG